MGRKFYFLFDILLFFFLLLGIEHLVAKEVLVDAYSSVKQVKFVVRSGDLIFTQKDQNINGKMTENWYVNNSSVSKDDYFNRMAKAEQEEKDIKREEEARKREEMERKKREEEERKRREEEEFLNETKIQALKKLVKLELEKVAYSFAKLDKYKLEQYFVFEEDTFSTSYSLEQTRVGLVNSSRELVTRAKESLSQQELKDVLAKLEQVPQKVERFLRKSVKFAIDQCNDTKRLKELLALI